MRVDVSAPGILRNSSLGIDGFSDADQTLLAHYTPASACRVSGLTDLLLAVDPVFRQFVYEALVFKGLKRCVHLGDEIGVLLADGYAEVFIRENRAHRFQLFFVLVYIAYGNGVVRYDGVQLAVYQVLEGEADVVERLDLCAGSFVLTTVPIWPPTVFPERSSLLFIESLSLPTVTICPAR